MKSSILRRMVNKGGVFGILAAGLIVALRELARNRVYRSIMIAAIIGGVLTYRALRSVNLNSAQVSPSNSLEAPVADDPAFDIIDLGTQGQGVVGSGINSRGDVAGLVLLSEESWHAAVWRGKRMVDIGTLGGTRSMAAAINDSSRIVGYSETASGSILAFEWRDGKMVSLDERLSGAADINKGGQIVGFAQSRDNRAVACRWKDGKAEELGVPSGFAMSFAEGVDDRGTVAGYAGTSKMDRIKALAWRGGKMAELTTPGHGNSVAVGAGPNDRIVGAASTGQNEDAPWNACVWINGRVKNLGRIRGYDWAAAVAVNKSGDLVGASGMG